MKPALKVHTDVFEATDAQTARGQMVYKLRDSPRIGRAITRDVPDWDVGPDNAAYLAVLEAVGARP